MHEYRSPRDAHRGLSNYFDFFNHRRPNQSLEGKTPADVYFNKNVSAS